MLVVLRVCDARVSVTLGLVRTGLWNYLSRGFFLWCLRLRLPFDLLICHIQTVTGMGIYIAKRSVLVKALSYFYNCSATFFDLAWGETHNCSNQIVC